MRGAIDTDRCPTRFKGRNKTDCKCKPVCIVCGFGPHAAVHGPLYGQPPGTKPWKHEYQPPKDQPEAEKYFQGEI